MDGRRCGVVRSKSAGTEPLSTGLKQLTEDGEAGVGRQRALRPGRVMIMMMMMMMMMMHRTNHVTSAPSGSVSTICSVSHTRTYSS